MRKKYLSHNLSKLKKKKRVTNEDIARETGLALSTIISIELNTIQDVNINTIVKISRFFEVSVQDFVYKKF